MGKEPASWGPQPVPQHGQSHLYKDCTRETLSVRARVLVTGAQRDCFVFAPQGLDDYGARSVSR